MKLEINKTHNMNCLDGMKLLPDNYIDLTVTSPPYDNLRNYNGYSFDFENIAKELYRVTKDGGVVVWVVADKTENGSESGTSFKQALYFISVGFNLHDTMIYAKANPRPNAGNRYQQAFEYMFVFSKGTPKTTNILLRPRKETTDGRTERTKSFVRDEDGNFDSYTYHYKDMVPRENIWEYKVGGGHSTNDKIAFKHPAIFPEKLAEDHILSWSCKGDLVMDIFSGSGTTRKMARWNNRNFIGFEISEEYLKIDNERNSLPWENIENTQEIDDGVEIVDLSEM